jgi:hypothetical protein
VNGAPRGQLRISLGQMLAVLLAAVIVAGPIVWLLTQVPER